MEAKKVWLIILTILFLGPIVFIGGCFPVGLVAFSSCFESSCSPIIAALGYLAIPVGVILAIWACYATIKKIVNSNPENASQPN